MDFDFRILAVLAPIAIAASWAGFNIFKAALGQVQEFLNKRDA
ncbi:photosystem II protein Y [Romeria aff. gracilis LEGE 07310]|uniref:Photosystem II reaction center protein Y n=1 Tax=Vasconcelosia minhoensis LEGE 07310 TaxID=915328 RepID=A0A8J7DBB7_9CYAN|nr:photosystem II protein Y [Romeria gracilis]MBE9077497.1 photosystem II protein Y [Romeria aff. gracilis LEGE 07310]